MSNRTLCGIYPSTQALTPSPKQLTVPSVLSDLIYKKEEKTTNKIGDWWKCKRDFFFGNCWALCVLSSNPAIAYSVCLRHFHKFVLNVRALNIYIFLVRPLFYTFSIILSNLMFYQSQITSVAEKTWKCLSYVIHGHKENISCVSHGIKRTGN